MNSEIKYNISISIPTSSLIQENSLIEKSLKVAWFARSASIFGIRNIFIYEDEKESVLRKDFTVLALLLEYLNVPQYLRKNVFSMREELQYAGILPPLKTPHHAKKIELKKISKGDIRVGMVSRVSGKKIYLDLGLGKEVPLFVNHDQKSYNYKIGNLLNVKFISKFPNLQVKEIPEKDIEKYWGYHVKFISNFYSFITEIKNDTLILVTTKKGTMFKDKKHEIATKLENFNNIVIFFGSPFRDLDELFPSVAWNQIPNIYFLNMFPCQNTETIRLEEAVFGSLSIFNEFLSELN